MDAITLLKDDHKAVAKLFRDYDGLGDRAVKTKRDLVDSISAELTVHAGLEEKIFYPFVSDRLPQVDDDVQEGVAEHHLMKVTIAELARLDVSDDQFEAKVTVLKELVEHHVDEEEDGWFPKVRETISRSDLAEVGDQMQVAKSKLEQEA